jgi:hypothetical protein
MVDPDTDRNRAGFRVTRHGGSGQQKGSRRIPLPWQPASKATLVRASTGRKSCPAAYTGLNGAELLAPVRIAARAPEQYIGSRF